MRRVGLAIAAVAMLALAGSPTGAVEPEDRTVAQTIDERGREASALAGSRGALGTYYDAESNRYVIAVAKGQGSTISASEIAELPGEVVVEERDIDQKTIDAVSERLEGMS